MSTRANIEKIDLKFGGMSCASYASSVERTISNVAGVFECNVNFGVEQATIQYDPRQTSPKKNQDAIERTGYSSYF